MCKKEAGVGMAEGELNLPAVDSRAGLEVEDWVVVVVVVVAVETILLVVVAAMDTEVAELVGSGAVGSGVVCREEMVEVECSKAVSKPDLVEEDLAVWVVLDLEARGLAEGTVDLEGVASILREVPGGLGKGARVREAQEDQGLVVVGWAAVDLAVVGLAAVDLVVVFAAGLVVVDLVALGLAAVDLVVVKAVVNSDSGRY